MMLESYRQKYHTELVESVVPFWLKHSLDHEFGGYFTCLDRDGTVYDTKKYMWLQGRQIYTLCRLYNELERRQEFLDAAKLGVDFIRRFGKDAKGRVYFSLTRDGRPFFYQRKVYGAVFYMMGLLHYAKATGDKACLAEAVATFWDVTKWLDDATLLDRPALAGALPCSNLANVMVLAGMVIELAQFAPDPRYKAIMQQALNGVRRHFEPKRRIFMENVPLENWDAALFPADSRGHIDGNRVASLFSEYPEGRWFNPGHSIEVAWFLLHLLEQLEKSFGVPQAPADKQLALDALEGSLQFGWDDEFGGLFYFMDIEGKPTLQLESSMKLWWPHTEAIYALVLAHKLTGEAKWLEWLEKVDAYAFSHFADPKLGDWFGYCDRRGNLTHTCKGGNYKGFFHVPRFLLMSIQAIDRK
jgi:N-acylglucosamine 2-epimerase